jgi:hypothetical protein
MRKEMADATVELEDDNVVTVALEDDGPKPETKPSEKPTAADEAAAELKKSLKAAEDARRAAEATAIAERSRADEAVRLAQQREQESRGFRDQAEVRELAIINSDIERATQAVAAAGDAFQRAQEAGDFAKSSEAQIQLARAAAALDRREADKAIFEANLKRATEAAATAAVQPAIAESPFEQYVRSFAPVAQAWLRAHPECVPPTVGGNAHNGSAQKNAKMMAGHFDALGKGLAEGSPEYFQTIEEHVGYRAPAEAASPVSTAADVTEAGGQQQRSSKPRSPQVSAPVTREPLGAPSSGRTAVRLTAEQQEVALLSTVPREFIGSDGRVVRESEADYRKRAFAQYASEYVKAKDEGKIGRLTH